MPSKAILSIVFAIISIKIDCASCFNDAFKSLPRTTASAKLFDIEPTDLVILAVISFEMLKASFCFFISSLTFSNKLFCSFAFLFALSTASGTFWISITKGISLPNSLNKFSTCSLTNPTAFATALTAPAKAFTAKVKTLLIALPIASKSAEFSSINSLSDLNSF